MGASPSPSPDAERVPIGSVLDGRYRIDAVLGSGGMGRVYRGEHTGIGRPVAIKVLHADLNRNRDAATRFQREAIASGRLDHPNIVNVSDFGVLDDGACYLVMEVLEGESLGARLERETRLAWREALDVLRGVLEGLRHAHDRGVVHRDIKPDNIFLARKDGKTVVKILDFGIAKLYAGSADDPASTRAGLTVGTPAYLSPEQAVGGEITPASDLYSATIVLYEMLTGRAPFEDKDPLAMLGAHVSRTPPAISDIALDVSIELPPGLEEMIQRGLAKPAAERIASAVDYLTWIESILVAAPPALGSAPRQMPPPEALGAMPTASLTPAPAISPGSLAMPVATAAQTQTPLPAVDGLGLTAAIEAIAPGELPHRGRAPSLADAVADPVPRRWVKIGAMVLAALVALAIILALATRGSSQPEAPAKAPTGSSAKRPHASPRTPATPPRPPPPPVADRATRLKAALYELENGKDCAARRAAVPLIVELGDPAALPALKRARYRMRGGVLGLGQSNHNACLTKDAVQAIKVLEAK
jgi:hypothetical protein